MDYYNIIVLVGSAFLRILKSLANIHIKLFNYGIPSIYLKTSECQYTHIQVNLLLSLILYTSCQYLQFQYIHQYICDKCMENHVIALIFYSHTPLLIVVILRII